jgi:hypothetical protein
MNQFTKDFESFKGTPYGQNRDYAADFLKISGSLKIIKILEIYI